MPYIKMTKTVNYYVKKVKQMDYGCGLQKMNLIFKSQMKVIGFT